MGLAAITAVLIAASPDGGTPDAGTAWADDPIYADCPKAPQPTPLADGSWNLSPLRAARNTCLMAACEDHRERLRDGPPAFGWFTWALAALAAGLALAGGFYLGFELRALFR